MTDSNRLPQTILFRVEPKVDQEGRGLVVVPDEVAHEGAVEIGVERNDFHLIPMNGIATNGRLRWCRFRSSFDFRRKKEMIRGIKFVSVPVRDQDAALKFYTELLGFKVQTDQEFVPGGQRWIELSIPGSSTGLALFTPEGQEERIGSFQPISFWCDDVFQTAEGLARRGVKFFQEAKKESWGCSAIFEDVEGNRFVLSSR